MAFLARRCFSSHTLPLTQPLVSPHSLHAALKATPHSIVLLDASYHIPLRLRLPAEKENLKTKIRSAFGMLSNDRLMDQEPAHVRDYIRRSDDEVTDSLERDAKREFEMGDRIEGSKFFDFSVIRDVLRSQPLMAPPPEDFAAFMDDLGIQTTDHIVLYDTVGVHTSPRAWWLFKLMGHENVSVLDGGLPLWKHLSYPTTPTLANASPDADTITDSPPPLSNATRGGYTPRYDASRVVEYQRLMGTVVDLMSVDFPVIVDVRPEDRHRGIGIEPLHTTKKMGTIPGSVNIPWREFVETVHSETDGSVVATTLKEPMEIIRVFKENGRRVDLDREMVVYGNDGVSAAVVCLCLEVLGKTSGVRLYEGGWSEWGVLDASPVTRRG
ncbi:hypothetical protein HDU98_003961 [Podochytrium sp. JEL0797]|nr:hypothetical protein HDU98_003961 [Podochytrium sp. JEL0797]